MRIIRNIQSGRVQWSPILLPSDSTLVNSLPCCPCHGCYFASAVETGVGLLASHPHQYLQTFSVLWPQHKTEGAPTWNLAAQHDVLLSFGVLPQAPCLFLTPEAIHSPVDGRTSLSYILALRFTALLFCSLSCVSCNWAELVEKSRLRIQFITFLPFWVGHPVLIFFCAKGRPTDEARLQKGLCVFSRRPRGPLSRWWRVTDPVLGIVVTVLVVFRLFIYLFATAVDCLLLRGLSSAVASFGAAL